MALLFKIWSTIGKFSRWSTRRAVPILLSKWMVGVTMSMCSVDEMVDYIPRRQCVCVQAHTHIDGSLCSAGPLPYAQ